MENGKHLVYEFGGFQLDPARQKLFCQGQPVALTPKLFETLVFLVENRDRTLLKDELMQALWTGTFVEEANLSQNIFLLRKALGDDRNGHSFIHTIPRRGYRFVAPVTEVESDSIGPLPGARDWEYWKKNSPFRSLTVFEEEDAWLFFGREAETAELVSRVEHSPVVAVVGNSGSGKSSLLRAGLIPALREGRNAKANGSNGTHGQECWRIAVFRPSAAPFDYLAEALPGQLAPELSVKEQAEFIADCRAKLPAGGNALRDAISALVFPANNNLAQAGHTRVLLAVDQFEELFTLTSKQAVHDRYIDALLGAARLDGAVPVHLVLSLRADFFGHCLDHSELSNQLETSLFTLSAMKPEQMRETIEKRLQLAGGRAEPGLIDSLLEDIGVEPGNLALLEHALGQLWEQCGGPGCTFTNSAYGEIGRLRGALGRHADAVFESLDEEQKHLAQKIFLELVHLGEGAQDTRRRVAKAELLALAQPDQVEQLLARLASSRLIATGRDGEETSVEVSHEALIREWPALRQWLAENREDLSLERRLVQAAEEWESLERDPGALLQGARLVQADDWFKRHGDTHEVLRHYINASLSAHRETVRKELETQLRELEQQKRTARRFRWFSYGLGVLLIVAAGSAWYAYRERILEKSRAMAAHAGELATRDRGQALDLAIRSWQIAETEEAHLALSKVFPQPGLVLRHNEAVYRTMFSPDGDRILSIAHDNAAKIWNAHDGRLVAALGHDGPLEDGTFSPDGKLVVTTSDDHTARIWDGINGHLISVLKGHTDKIVRASFSNDGKRVITGSLDHTARVWDTANGHLIMTLSGHSNWVYAAAFSPDGRRIVTGGWDKTARLWDALTGNLLSILQGHTDGVFYADFSPDGEKLATAGADGTVRIWSSRDGRLLNILAHKAEVSDIAFSADGRRIATSSHDSCARIWSSSNGSLLATLRHDGPVHHVEFSADGRRLVTASFDHTARVWSAKDGRLLAILQGHNRELYHAAFSPSGEQVVTGSGDHTVRTWLLSAARSESILQHDSQVETAAFSPDGELLATGSDNGKVRLWSVAKGQQYLELRGHTGPVWRLSFSPDSHRIASGSSDASSRVWDTRDGRLLALLSGHTKLIGDVRFSPDGSQIMTASWDHTARLWNANDGRTLAVLQGAEPLFYVNYLPDGQRLFTNGVHGAYIWRRSDGRLLSTIRNPRGPVHQALSFPDGKVVTGSDNGVVRLWNPDGRLLVTLRGPSSAIERVGFSSDRRRVVGIGADNNARIWDTADGSLKSILRGHTAIIWSAKFSPDGKSILTASDDQTARLWDSDSGQLLTTLEGHMDNVNFAIFAPNGRFIVTGSKDHTSRIWEILTLDDIERILSK